MQVVSRLPRPRCLILPASFAKIASGRLLHWAQSYMYLVAISLSRDAICRSIKWLIQPPIFGRHIDITKSHAKQLLKSQYRIVGDTDQMTKSTSAILIRFTGYVPRQCNCTPNVEPSCTNVNLAHNESSRGHAHGVQHHGASYKPHYIASR